jgi:hypothetical protein
MASSKFARKMYFVFVLWICGALCVANQNLAGAGQDATAKDSASVSRGSEPIQMIGTVVAMSQHRWENVGYSFHVLLFRIDKILGGKESARFVRADFPAAYIFTNSEEARVYSHLESSLREPKIWKVHLRPTHGSVLCAWRIPAPPRTDDLAMAGTPIIVSVGGASGYPDINTVPCYVFDQGDIQEITMPEKAK